MSFGVSPVNYSDSDIVSFSKQIVSEVISYG